MDCLEGMRQLDDNSVDLIITDPPYEVNYNSKSSELEKLGKSRQKQIERDSSFVDVIVDYEALSLEFYRLLKNNTHIYLFCGDKQIVKWSLAMTKAGFKSPQILVWKKNKTTFDMTMGYKYPENKEFILFFQKGWRKLNGYSNERHKFRSVLNFDSSDDTDFHSCAKPINLLMFLVKASSDEGDLCLDAFSGGGNHVIAFKRLNRAFVGFELSPVYCETVNKRLLVEKTQVQLDGFGGDE
jgi:site-specific DNA-methyltransferase (adenine-specific)